MTGRPALTRPEEWAGFDDCVTCSAPAGTACLALTDPHDELRGPHASRTARVRRTPGGELLLARWHNRAAGPNARSLAAALHVVTAAGTAVCNGAALTLTTATPLSEAPARRRCRRPSCTRIWKAEAWR